MPSFSFVVSGAVNTDWASRLFGDLSPGEDINGFKPPVMDVNNDEGTVCLRHDQHGAFDASVPASSSISTLLVQDSRRNNNCHNSAACVDDGKAGQASVEYVN